MEFSASSRDMVLKLTCKDVVTFGRIGALWNIRPGNYAIGQVDAAATNGMSGGGVFNKFGEFLGVVVTASSFNGNIRYVRFEEIKEVIGAPGLPSSEARGCEPGLRTDGETGRPPIGDSVLNGVTR